MCTYICTKNEYVCVCADRFLPRAANLKHLCLDAHAPMDATCKPANDSFLQRSNFNAPFRQLQALLASWGDRAVWQVVSRVAQRCLDWQLTTSRALQHENLCTLGSVTGRNAIMHGEDVRLTKCTCFHIKL